MHGKSTSVEASQTIDTPTIAGDEIEVTNYISEAAPEVRSDLSQLIGLIQLIAPEATLHLERGVPVFYLGQHWTFSVIAHQKRVSLIFDDFDIQDEGFSFRERLKKASFGDHCISFKKLNEGNLNVIAELLGKLKVDTLRKYPLQKKSIH
ncbi:DUF1801 domain-containing protein [Marinomonas mediterranea]|jgi:Domain of unknown function (DU1801).|uniref:YdhG-like domain-containing protein n=1 Tax=Marinomonas mediterranea (strain ATCC 700492 / JCM 21426 / NBRC 103028 / MMB-1) TaxID=717774 RepID=F2K490_MARM1|nr:DUF1801 domain-containing protein [Marinomonas mediterranea]ADZ92531.1 hypothetical protein Marme_3315 [Marinomonas mediterranea MMB-1]WCN10477.1 hypothetical protein GV055_16895 [Marinomonas mediterranea]WCN14525.1 hypothetical protein GV054_16720 [Marinomonas mediterranea]WCN18576.1 hypothetical protein GV053_16785 [Marinomonas mediterranea MMB-1]